MTQRVIIRFNKTRGKEGRGTMEHVWRVFDEQNQEYLVKHLQIEVPSYDLQTGEDYNVCCHGILSFDKDTSTAIVKPQ
jgi:hypothetical protein